MNLKSGLLISRLFSISLAGALILLMVGAITMPAGTAAAGVRRQDGADEPRTPDPESSAREAADWLLATHVNDDGGFSSFSAGANTAPSDVGGTVDAMLALAAADAGVSPQIDYLTDNIHDVASYASQDGSTAGKLVLALSAAGQDPAGFIGHNFVISLTNHLSPTGQYNVQTAFNQSLAILAVTMAGQAAPTEAVDWLVGLQETEGDLAGSWDDGFGTPGNADSTALAIMALAGVQDPSAGDAISPGMDFLARTQLGSGGWEYGAGFGENANSTALVIQALLALGEDVASTESNWAVDGRTPFDVLLSWQGESGAFQVDFGDGPLDDFFSTVQAVPAVAAVTIPEEPPAPADTPQPEPTVGETAIPVASETSPPDPSIEPAEPEPGVTSENAPSDETDAGSPGIDTADNNSSGGIPTWIIVIAVIVVLALVGLVVRRQTT